MRPTVADIDLRALRRNFDVVRQRLRPNVAILPIVKANAYGHGAVPVARTLLEAGVTCLGVALVEEALELRQAGIDAPILVLGCVAVADIPALIAEELAVVVFDLGFAEELSRQALRRQRQARVHVKVDTGMNRLGIPPDEAPAFIEKLADLKGLVLEGLMTHFATADEQDDGYLREQHAAFTRLVERLAQRGQTFPHLHCANSAAIMHHPATHADMVRPGIVLYGAHATATPHSRWPVEPVLTLRSRIAQLRFVSRGSTLSYGRSYTTARDALIATLPIGYGDGYSRALSNRGDVLVRGRRAPIVGNLCMDLTLVDVTEVPQAALGDEVILIGSQGDEQISVEELARHCGSVPHEIFCQLGSRLPRRYQT
ncbi:MAG: alanine racemase [Candidatus Tectomicrobia bacterium]|nr:alanine racemase [Candidatus Tectomicrobia bacterium]